MRWHFLPGLGKCVLEIIASFLGLEQTSVMRFQAGEGVLLQICVKDRCCIFVQRRARLSADRLFDISAIFSFGHGSSATKLRGSMVSGGVAILTVVARFAICLAL